MIQRDGKERARSAGGQGNGRGNAIFREQKDQRRRGEMASEINLLRDLDSWTGKIYDEGPTDRIRIHCKLNASSRLRREGKPSLVMDRIGLSSFCNPSFPDLNVESPLHRWTRIGELHPQGKGVS
jgi:hypothetical protein